MTDRRSLLAQGLAAAALAPDMARAQAAPQPPVTEVLSRFISEGARAPIPEAILDLGRLHILDTLASIVACRDLEAAVLARRFALAQSADARRSAVTILGTKQRAALIDAVFAGAMTGHGAEINDFIPSAFVQPGPSIVSAVLGLCEQRKLSGAAALRSVIVGYEMASRFPKALGNGNLNRSGLANHGVGPIFGVAAASAALVGLPKDRIGDVLTFCSQQAAGSWQWTLDVEHVEKAFVFAGMGARSGLQAALFVEGGFRGVRDNLDQPGGFLNQGMFTGPNSDLDRRKLIAGLGAAWEMPMVAFKRFPTGGPTQPAVQALLNLLPKVRTEQVASVLIEMPGRAATFRDAAMPALNLRYLAAIILIDGKLDFTAAQSLPRMNGDGAVRALMNKVEVVVDAKQEAPPGAERVESARVTIVLADGRRHVEFVPYVLGFPSHPMKRADVEAKATELMAPVLGAGRAQAVIRQTTTIDAMTNAGDFARLIAR